MNEFTLDAKVYRWIMERHARITALQSELSGALSLLVEMHGLEGRWQLDLENKRLVRSDEPPQLKAA
jgi:hypothetical protein